jgi:hypothetical protein
VFLVYGVAVEGPHQREGEIMRAGIAALLATTIVCIGLAEQAGATIIVTRTLTAGTGGYAGQDIYRYFAAFSPTSPEAMAGATGLSSIKCTLSIQGAGTFQYTTGQFDGADFPANPDVDVIGGHATDAALRLRNDPGDSNLLTAVGTGAFVHEDGGFGFSFQGLFVDGVGKPLTVVNNTGTSNGYNLFQNAQSIRIEGYIPPGPGGVQASDSSAKTLSAGQDGAGALFAVAVVPHNAVLQASGVVAADKGDLTAFPVMPEPSSVAMVSVAAFGVLLHRRRGTLFR